MGKLDRFLDNGYIVEITKEAFHSLDVKVLGQWCLTNNLDDEDWLYISAPTNAKFNYGEGNKFKFRYEADAVSYMLIFGHTVKRN